MTETLAPLVDRIQEAAHSLSPVQPRYCIVWRDPADTSDRVRVTHPAPEWLAQAISGGILPPVDSYHRMRVALTLADGSEIACTEIEAQEIRVRETVIDETVVDATPLLADPIGPLTEEQAMEYLLAKDVPARVWRPDVLHNQRTFLICRREQLPESRRWRNAWRIAA